MKKIAEWNHCRLFFAVLALLLLAGTCLLLSNGKSGSFLLLNKWHFHATNVLFQKITFFGDGLFALWLTAIALIFYRQKQLGVALFYSFIISGISTQIIKYTLPSPRPRLFFQPGVYHYFMDGFSQLGNNSFPSGHTSAAFAIATVLVFTFRNTFFQLTFLVAAALVGFSRIYLGSHFLLDVMVGAVVGVLSGLLALHAAQLTEERTNSNREKLTAASETFNLPHTKRA